MRMFSSQVLGMGVALAASVLAVGAVAANHYNQSARYPSMHFVSGHCLPPSNVAQGPLGSDLRKRQKPYACNGAVVTLLDADGHAMVGFTQTGTGNPSLAYAGTMERNDQVLDVNHIFLRAPPPHLAELNSQCQFYFERSRMSEIVCGGAIDESGERVALIIDFKAEYNK